MSDQDANLSRARERVEADLKSARYVGMSGVMVKIADLRIILDALDGLGRGDEPPHEPDGWPCPSDMLAGTLSISGRSPRTIRIDFEDVDAANRLLEWLTELNPILDPKPPEPKP